MDAQLAERHKLQAIFRADVHAAAAKDALRAFGFVAVENRIDPALEAAGSFLASLFLGVADLHFRHARAALQAESWGW